MTTRIGHQVRRCAWIGAGILLIAGCKKEEPDAYGNFEAEEVVISAEVPGELRQFDLEEGSRIIAGSPVGLIDTTQLSLQRRELVARKASIRSRTNEVGEQVDVLLAQVEVAKREYERTQRLFKAQAATAQQLDRAERDYRTLGQQIEATRATGGSVQSEIASIDAQIARIEDQIRKSRIVNPVNGTVLTRYVERAELVQVGQPLYKLADLDTLTLRAYVSESQLAGVRLGQSVQVLVDAGRDSLRVLHGRVTWIASQAEFTPTPIQTRDERADQVYAVKIRVANPNGALKIGMPGELVLARDGGQPGA